MKIINIIFSAVFIVILLMVSSLFLVPLLPFENNIQIKIVESGSMEPSILTGSLVVIRPQTSYGVGDVVTFESASADVPTTHRIIGVRESAGQTFFMTKGDANEEADTQEATLRSVIGEVELAVPYAGFVLDFARQPLGFLFLIVLPALLIIFGEIEKIWQHIKKSKQPKIIKAAVKDEALQVKSFVPVVAVAKVRMMDIARPVARPTLKIRPVTPTTNFSPGRNYVVSSYVAPVCIVLSSFLFTAMSFTGSTVSYFNDIETAIENLLQASALDFSLSPKNYSFVFDAANGINEAVVKPVITIEDGEAPVSYDVAVEVLSASSTLCGALLVETTLPFIYSGKLTELVASSVQFNDAWSLTVTLDGAALINSLDTCAVNLVYTARRVGVSSTAGYEDMEKIALQFSMQAPTVSPAAKVAPLMLLTGTETEPVIPEENDNSDQTGTSTSTPSTDEPITEAPVEELTNEIEQVIPEPEPEVPVIEIEETLQNTDVPGTEAPVE